MRIAPNMLRRKSLIQKRRQKGRVRLSLNILMYLGECLSDWHECAFEPLPAEIAGLISRLATAEIEVTDSGIDAQANQHQHA